MAKVSEVVRKIKKKTKCYLLREGRSHEIWINPDTGKEFQPPLALQQRTPYRDGREYHERCGAIKAPHQIGGYYGKVYISSNLFP